MNIIINENLVPTLERLAREQNLTVEQCVISNIEAYLSTQKRLEIVRTVENDIPTYEPVIMAKKIEVEEIQRIADETKAIEDAAAIGAETTATRAIQE